MRSTKKRRSYCRSMTTRGDRDEHEERGRRRAERRSSSPSRSGWRSTEREGRKRHRQRRRRSQRRSRSPERKARDRRQRDERRLLPSSPVASANRVLYHHKRRRDRSRSACGSVSANRKRRRRHREKRRSSEQSKDNIASSTVNSESQQVHMRDPEIECHCEGDKRLRSEDEKRYLAYCVSLLNMLQMAGVDPFSVLTNAPLPQIEEEFTRHRAMSVGFQGIPTDCTNVICEFLNTREVCALRRISVRCQQIAASASTHARYVVYREDVDGDPVTWLEEVGKCFTNIASVDIPRRDHMLQLACERNNAVAIRVLMADSRFDGHPSYFREHRLPTPLIVASRVGDADLVARLLSRKEVDIASPSTMRIRTRIRDEVYECATPLHAACAFGRIDVVPLLLASPRCDIHAMAVRQNIRSPGSSGGSYCAIHLAAEFHGADVIPLLLEHPDADVNKLTSHGWSTLRFAFHSHAFRAMQVLLKHPEVNVDITWEDAYNGDDPLRWHDAEARQCMDLLLDDPRFDTQLHDLLRFACETGESFILDMLLAHAKVDVNARFSGGRSALHILVSEWRSRPLTSGCLSCFALLLGDDRFDPNSRDSEGLTAVDILTGERCNGQLLSAVLRCRRVNVNVGISTGGSIRTPLQNLVKNMIRGGMEERAKCVAAFADRDDADFAVKDDAGNTLLHTASWLTSCFDSSYRLVKELVRVFTERNLSIEARNASGETPLDLAKKNFSFEAIPVLKSALGIQESDEDYPY